MQAAQLIHSNLPVLQVTDLVRTALDSMEAHGVTSLPVADAGVFLGFVEDEILLEQENLQTSLTQVQLESSSCWVYSDQHLYDVLRLAQEQHAAWIGVVDRSQQLLGVISNQEALAAYADSFSVHSPGAVLVLTLEMKDYQLSEISRLVESENVKILSVLLNTDPLEPQSLEVTLKLDTAEVRHVKATLSRFGYQVADYSQEETGSSSEEERIGNLLRFLDL